MFTLCWINSLAASAITVGIFFIVESAYGFSAQENLLLGLLMGAAYIPGAIGVGPGLRRLAERIPWLSMRGALVFVLLGLAILATLPRFFVGERWIIWPAIGGHLMLSGALWPIVESYMSGGRTGERLRITTAKFNLCWSSASFAVMWLAAPLIAKRPLDILLLAGALHAGSCLLLPLFRTEPGRHVPEHQAPHPPTYRRLLVVFRWLLPTGYVMAYCLSPLMPTLVERVGVADKSVNLVGMTWAWSTPLASAWLFSRIGSFALFAGWQGWHGRWSTPIWTGGGMALGFALAVTASTLPVLVVGLLLFGIGLGGVYACALYYALEVGHAEVDAGGAHEALIGVGYTLGPLAGLAGLTAASGLERPAWSPWLTVGSVGLIVGMAMAGAIQQAFRGRG